MVNTNLKSSCFECNLVVFFSFPAVLRINRKKETEIFLPQHALAVAKVITNVSPNLNGVKYAQNVLLLYVLYARIAAEPKIF